MFASKGAFPLVGVGGIDSGGAALTKIRAGASLIQLYSALVYKGLGLVDEIKTDLVSMLRRTGRDSPQRDRRRRRGQHHRGRLAAVTVPSFPKSRGRGAVSAAPAAGRGWAR